MEDQSRQYGQENLTLPHDVVPLPSEGFFYKNKKRSVKVGYLTAADENIIMGGSDNLTLNLIRNKLYEPDLKVEELLEGDVEAILIFLRNSSFGPDININATDPKTSKQFSTTVRLDELPIVKGQEPNADGTFTLELPKSKVSVKLKPLTLGDSSEISKILDSYPQGRISPSVTTKLQKQIVDVGGNTDKGYIAKFIEQLPISDSKLIKKFLDENTPRLDLRKTITTPSGEKLTINVGFGVEFFRPFF